MDDPKKTLKVPPLHDIIRMGRNGPRAVVGNLESWYNDSAPFNLELARFLTRKMYEGSLSYSAVQSACMGQANELARKPNLDVVQLVHAHAQNKHVQCYDAPSRAFPIRAGLAIPIKVDFYYVEDGKIYFCWMQPRKGFALDFFELSLIARGIKQWHLVDDFEEAGLEILDLSAPKGERQRRLRTYTLADFKMPTYEAFSERLEWFIDAYDELMAYGFIPKPRRTRKSARE